jgi:hypothetical protein
MSILAMLRKFHSDPSSKGRVSRTIRSGPSCRRVTLDRLEDREHPERPPFGSTNRTAPLVTIRKLRLPANNDLRASIVTLPTASS